MTLCPFHRHLPHGQLLGNNSNKYFSTIVFYDSFQLANAYGETCLPEGVALLCMEADVGSLMHRPLSWGDDQQNISMSALRGVFPDLPIWHTPDVANDFSRQYTYMYM